VALNAPKPDEAPSGVRGNRDEAMTVRQQPIWELNPLQATLFVPGGIIFVMSVEGLKGRNSILDA